MTPSRKPSQGLPSVLASLPIALLILMSACSSGGGGASPTTSSSTTSTSVATPSSAPPEAAAVESGYRAFWDAYLAAADPMNPTNPVLAAHATGDELQQVQAAFAQHFANGEVIRGRLDLAPHVQSVDGSAATVTDCYGDSTHVFDATTGQQKDPQGDNHFQITAHLVLDGGAWKVSSISKEGEGCTPS